jgi:hypothetical protein
MISLPFSLQVDITETVYVISTVEIPADWDETKENLLIIIIKGEHFQSLEMIKVQRHLQFQVQHYFGYI